MQKMMNLYGNSRYEQFWKWVKNKKTSTNGEREGAVLTRRM